MSAAGPLAGLKVVEAGLVIAGPFCGSLLADQGAQVIKVERPDSGDPVRQMGPAPSGVPLWWGVAARDKHCVGLDLKDPAERERFLTLIEEADVFVENYRPGVLERLGLGFDVLSARNPRLVVMSVSGFGQSGPYGKRPGFGKIAECFSGLLPVTGAPEETPLFVGFSLADTTAGLMGAMAINMALWHRDCAGGRAVHIDVALYEPLLRMMETQFALMAATGEPPRRRGTNDPYGWGAPGVPERWFVPVTMRDGAEAFVLVDGDSRPRIRTLTGGDTDEALQAWAATVDADEAAEQLRRHGIEAGRVHDGLSMAGDAYFRARGDVIDAPCPEFPAMAVPGRVPRRSDRGAERAFRPAAIGEDDAMLPAGRQSETIS
ncbi:CaiB/BaiF CoA transferase family protein [Acuticoccus sediminis]|uniref:CaiB/BaiF CoA transferase family protein n=1 Tax=Acuticoccus sediminis TaxID=2184697 RepID=UPI001CFCA2D0|nr:CoA transferase [Acuticoccus sediminis]